MKLITILFLSLGVTGALVATPAMEYRDLKLPILNRKKRYLAFPKGSSLQLVYCFLVAALGTENFFTIGITLGLAWEIPENIQAVLKKKSPNSVRRRDAKSLFPSIEGFLHRLGLNGRACVLRAICEATYRSKRTSSFMEEIIHSIFTFPDLSEEELGSEMDDFTASTVYDFPRKNATLCLQYYHECPIPIIDMDMIT